MFVPEHRKNFYKFWWNESLDLLKQASITSNRVWKAAGKPRTGPLFEERQSCRREYRARRKHCERESELAYTNELHEALMKKMVQLSGRYGNQNLVLNRNGLKLTVRQMKQL